MAWTTFCKYTNRPLSNGYQVWTVKLQWDGRDYAPASPGAAPDPQTLTDSLIAFSVTAVGAGLAEGLDGAGGTINGALFSFSRSGTAADTEGEPDAMVIVAPIGTWDSVRLNYYTSEGALLDPSRDISFRVRPGVGVTISASAKIYACSTSAMDTSDIVRAADFATE